MKRELIFVLIIIAAAATLFLYSMLSNPYAVTEYEPKPLTLSKGEEAYIKSHPTVTLSISEDLLYMDEEFYEKLLNSMTASAGLKVRITSESEGEIRVVGNEVQEQTTSPIFEVTGSLFVNKAYKGNKGVYVKGQMDDKLSYNDKKIELIQADTLTEAMNLAEREKLPFIAGDQMAIKAEGYENTYAELYKSNVCITLTKSNTELYNLLNRCIQNADKALLLNRAQGNHSISPVEDNRYEDAAILLIIVFTAVFCTFFLYYYSNKNLYDELTDRMNQLTASKAEMQTTFNGVSYYMAELSPDGEILDINKAFLEYVGEEALGKSIGKILPDESITEMIECTSSTGKETSKEINLKRKVLEINIFSITDSKLLFMASDITGERMAERQLLQDNKMIAVGQLAAGVAHEIRNPMGLIRNYCYVLKNIKDPEKEGRAIEGIEKSVEASNKIIDSLLNFSRVSQRKAERVDIRQRVDSILALQRLRRKKGVSFLVNFSEDFSAVLPAESLDMILINLISNAVDAIEDMGEITINVTQLNDRFRVEITDDGVGIKEDIIEEIFNPFFTTKSSAEGNGLGLYIVYNEIDKMNGEIHVDSRVGVGTTFILTLPVEVQ